MSPEGMAIRLKGNKNGGFGSLLDNKDEDITSLHL